MHIVYIHALYCIVLYCIYHQEQSTHGVAITTPSLNQVFAYRSGDQSYNDTTYSQRALHEKATISRIYKKLLIRHTSTTGTSLLAFQQSFDRAREFGGWQL